MMLYELVKYFALTTLNFNGDYNFGNEKTSIRKYFSNLTEYIFNLHNCGKENICKWNSTEY